MNRPTLVHFAAAVVVTGFAWTGARAADDTCRSGYVWREAFPGDRVCVTPPTRDQAAQDNAQAGARRQAGGAYGPDTCRSGYVWREAGANDRVCVTPPTRDQAAKDNAQAAARRVASQAPAAAQPAASYRVSDWSGWSRAAGSSTGIAGAGTLRIRDTRRAWTRSSRCETGNRRRGRAPRAPWIARRMPCPWARGSCCRRTKRRRSDS